MVFAPPRTGKSEIVSRRAPAYILGKFPDSNILTATYGASLSRKMNRDVQRIIDGKEYKEVFPNTKLYGKNVRSTAEHAWLKNSDEFEIVDHKGYYRGVGVGASITGIGGEFIIIDDPHKDAKEAASSTFRERIWEWYREDIYNRLEKDDHLLITNTRRHHDDLCGRLIAAMNETEDKELCDNWTILNFPAIKEKEVPYMVKEDLREEGESLWPEKFDKKRYAKIERNAGPYTWVSLFQGNPTIKGGNLFKSNNFRYWEKDLKTGELCCYKVGLAEPIRVRLTELRINCFVDPALEEKKSNDPTCMHVYGYSAKYKIWLLLDRTQDRFDHTKILNIILNFAFKNNAQKIGIENEKIGKIIVKESAGNDQIGNRKIPFIEIKTNGLDKYTRAVPMASYIENERIFFPKNAIWLGKFETNLINFPKSDEDHDIDCLSMASTMESQKTLAEILLENNS